MDAFNRVGAFAVRRRMAAGRDDSSRSITNVAVRVTERPAWVEDPGVDHDGRMAVSARIGRVGRGAGAAFALGIDMERGGSSGTAAPKRTFF